SDRVTVLHGVEEVLDWYHQQEGTLFVLGGGQIFTAFAPYIEELIVTHIHGQFDGDIFFPEVFPMGDFQLQSEQFRPKDEANPVDFIIKNYKRR
ncbi:dihydrofolate reductase, partial [Streptococcus suis]